MTTEAKTIPHNTKTSTNRGKHPAFIQQQWPRGYCPNPNGRPKQAAEVTKYAACFTIEAVDYQVSVMRNEKAKNADRLRAANLILDRAIGKAREHVDVSIAGSIRATVEHMLPAELEAMRVLLQSAQERMVPALPAPVVSEAVDAVDAEFQALPGDSAFEVEGEGVSGEEVES